MLPTWTASLSGLKKLLPTVTAPDVSGLVANSVKVAGLGTPLTDAARGEGGMNSGRSLALMSAGKLDADAIITHHFALDQVHDAFRTYVDRVGNALKVVMHV